MKLPRYAAILRSRLHAHRRSITPLAVAVAAAVSALIGVSAWFLRDIAAGLPDGQALQSVGSMARATTLFDVHDRPAFVIFKEQRIEVPLTAVSPHLVRAIVAIEDQRFYDHRGIDVVRVFGAALSNLRQGRVAEGGSTITQQLARQSFLSRDRTIRRKLKEIVVAARLEGAFSKDEILELYLNKVYFGNALYGVEAASLGYFGKHASELDVAEAALLAGLVKSPSAYAPTVSLDRAVARRRVVLDRMLEAGVIDAATHDAAAAAPVVLRNALHGGEAFGQYFKEEVRKQLVQRFGWERVYEGGLRVYTTIDPDLQRAAEAHVARSIDEIERRSRSTRGMVQPADADPLQAALVAMDPRTGEVRALVGGRDFGRSPFNRAVQARRQPGSAFKPFVYAAAIERGFSPATLITNLDEPTLTVEGAWVPEDEHVEGNAITMRAALRTSSNRAAVRLLQHVGIPAAVAYASRLGVGAIPSVPSLALGSGEVTLVSMTAAFAAFANKGLVPAPTLIRRVESADGTVLFDGRQEPRRAISEATAFLMSTMMADVVNAGTAAAARRHGFMLPAAGKTGTTDDYHDAWFIGFTPRIAAGVWLGYDRPRTIASNGYAAELAVPLWARFMRDATHDHQPEWFRPPASVTSAAICRLSGRLATSACRTPDVLDDEGNPTGRSMVYTEYFVRGSEPVDYCPIHGLHGAGRLAHTAPGVATAGGTRAETLAVPPAPPAAADARAVEAEPQRPQRRRGFWSRLFGIGRDDDSRDEERRRREEQEKRERDSRGRN